MIDIRKISDEARSDSQRADTLRSAIDAFNAGGMEECFEIETRFRGKSWEAADLFSVEVRSRFGQIAASVISKAQSELQEIESRWAPFDPHQKGK